MTQTDPFVSSLNAGRERFLAEALEYSFSRGRRTPEDFIRHFSPSSIMERLDGFPTLRATFLTVLVGLRERTALRTPSSDAGRLLDAALAEGDCDAESIVRLFGPDDWIRYLDGKRVWAFLMEGEFWKVSRSKDSAGYKAAQAQVAFLIERGIAHALHTPQDVIDGITVEVLADKLPRADLAKVTKRALAMGREGQPFTDRDLFTAVPVMVIVDHVALPQVMDSVVMPMARQAAFVDAVPSHAAALDEALLESTPLGSESA